MTARIRFPGSTLDGRQVEIVEDVPDFNIAAPDAAPYYCRMYIVRLPDGSTVALHPAVVQCSSEAMPGIAKSRKTPMITRPLR